MTSSQSHAMGKLVENNEEGYFLHDLMKSVAAYKE